jgi:putative transposase
VLILEYKLRVNQRQRAAIDEAIRTTQVLRTQCLRLWMETRGTGDTALQAYCAPLAQDFPFAAQLNSMARQAAADRAWAAISRFYKHCQEHKPGTQASRRGQAKGYPRFQQENRSVEDKTSGWKLEPDGKSLTQHPRARHWANAADWQTEA